MSNMNQNSSEASPTEVFEQVSDASSANHALTVTMPPRMMSNILGSMSTQMDKDASTINALYTLIEKFAAEVAAYRDQLKFAGGMIQDEHEMHLATQERLNAAYASMDNMHNLLEILTEENIETSSLLFQQQVDHQEYAQWAESERKMLREEAKDIEQELANADALILSLRAELAEREKKLNKTVQENVELARANHSGQLSQGDAHAQLAELGKQHIAVVQENNSLHIENDVLASKLFQLDEQNRMLKAELRITEQLLAGEQFPEGYDDAEIPESNLVEDLEQAFMEEDGLAIEDDLDAYTEWLEKHAQVETTEEPAETRVMIH